MRWRFDRRDPWSLSARTSATGISAQPEPGLTEDFEGFFPEESEIVGLYRAVSDLPGPRLQPVFQRRSSFGRIERTGMAFQHPEELRQRPRPLKDLAHGLHPMTKHQGVRILAVR